MFNLQLLVSSHSARRLAYLRRVHGITMTTLLALLLVLYPGATSVANNYNLPELGDSSSAIITPQQEFELGQTWLRQYRSQVPLSDDPQIYTYVENLLNRLAQHSQLKNRRLDLIVVKNPTLNAFAVPGGVVGVHTGLLMSAESEGQLAYVLAHELAHLSQRHFARGVEKQQQNSVPQMAALLASLVLIATAGGDAGLAALTASQAAALDSRLRFSRQNEQEADRIGMQTMIAAGEDPHAVAAMFERMLQGSRYSRRPPEFLLTHPVTEKRIADAMNRARQYPRKQIPQVLDFHLMRARAQLLHESTPNAAVKRFADELDGESLSAEASRYGLVLALTRSSQIERARTALGPLLEERPDKIAYIIAAADIEVAADNLPAAMALLEKPLQSQPAHHALNVRYAEVLMAAGQYPLAEEVLVRHVERHPKNDYVWYLLAEVHGLAGNILGVHEARAEYFILNGVFDKARLQLENALKMSNGNFLKTALLNERLREVSSMQDRNRLN